MKQTRNSGRNCPSPCNKCTWDSCQPTGKHYQKCYAYQKWVSWWWKQYKKLFYRTEPAGKSEKFTYSHPDTVRRYLQESPCTGCRVQDTCDIPCKAYLRWYDARMEITRKKVGL